MDSLKTIRCDIDYSPVRIVFSRPVIPAKAGNQPRKVETRPIPSDRHGLGTCLRRCDRKKNQTVCHPCEGREPAQKDGVTVEPYDRFRLIVMGWAPASAGVTERKTRQSVIPAKAGNQPRRMESRPIRSDRFRLIVMGWAPASAGVTEKQVFSLQSSERNQRSVFRYFSSTTARRKPLSSMRASR